jgi:HK97 family phage prohead protease
MKTFILSDGSLNTKRLIIPTSAIDTKAFAENPVMLYMHDRKNVIGRWEKLRIETEKLMADPVFDTEDTFAKNIASKVNNGFLKAASIGVRNVKGYETELEDGSKAIQVTYCELCEVSIVSVPANRSALTLYDKDNNPVLYESAIELADFPAIKPLTNSKKEMDTKKLAKQLGLPETATEEQIEASLSDAMKAQGDLTALRNANKTTQKAKAVTLTDAAITDGRLPKENKETFLSFADRDFDLFERTLAAIPKPVSLADYVKKGVQNSTKQKEGRKDWNFSKWQEEDAKGLQDMQLNDSEAYQALYEAEFAD